MRQALQHAARALSNYAALTARPGPASTLPQRSSVCIQCQFRAFSAAPSARTRRTPPSPLSIAIRQLSSSARALQDKPPSQPNDPQTPAIEDAAKRASEPSSQEPPELPASPAESPSSSPSSSPSPPPSTPPQPEKIEHVPDEQLPSHRQGLRWEIYKKASAWMDELLPKLILVGQKVNSYTGTDYSGIEALRKEIKQQERLVKSRRAEVEDAKRQLEAAQAQQHASQKEVVGLLERKHSWSAGDLERYMALIRSEHLNDQAVRSAKDAVLSTERALEEARAHMEKRERAQYHEEQIWSDTIRRNSTWVTIGLMGVNILLLLSQLVAIEPWRRRRLVREIKAALDERTMTTPAVAAGMAAAAPADLSSAPAPVAATEDAPEVSETANAASPAVEKEIDEIVEPAGVPLEAVEAETPAQDPSTGTFTVSADLSGPEPTVPLPEESPRKYAAPSAWFSRPRPAPETASERMAAFAEDCNDYVHDLFSERAVSVRKVDITTATLQGAAAGAAFVGLVLLAFVGSGGNF